MQLTASRNRAQWNGISQVKESNRDTQAKQGVYCSIHTVFAQNVKINEKKYDIRRWKSLRHL